MSQRSFLATLVIELMLPWGAFTQQHQFTIDTKPGAPIQPTMYGIFFEDINFGADYFDIKDFNEDGIGS